ncbi:MAG: hypothetical protein D6812_15945 [Deltaproteobacteria bacterium]|nr:MAG: hypothetical protein D6812_15945 [Deltaproteobacteria bacterium]
MESNALPQMLRSRNWLVFLDILRRCRQASHSRRDLETMLAEKEEEIGNCLQDGITLNLLYEKEGRFYLTERGEEFFTPRHHETYNAPLLRKLILATPGIRALEKFVQQEGSSLEEIGKPDIQSFLRDHGGCSEAEAKRIASAMLEWIKRALSLPAPEKTPAAHEIPKYVVPSVPAASTESPHKRPLPGAAGEGAKDAASTKKKASASAKKSTKKTSASAKKSTKEKKPRTRAAKEEEPKEKRKYLEEYDLPLVGELDRIALIVFAIADERITTPLLARSLKVKKEEVARYIQEALRLGLVTKEEARYLLSERGQAFVAADPKERAAILSQAFEQTKLFQLYQHFIEQEFSQRTESFDPDDSEATARQLELLKTFLDRFCAFEAPENRDRHLVPILQMMQSWIALRNGEIDLSNPFQIVHQPIEELGFSKEAVKFLHEQDVKTSEDLEKFDLQEFLSKPEIDVQVIVEISKVRGNLLRNRLTKIGRHQERKG